MELNNIFVICVATVAIAFFVMISSCQQSAEELAAEAEIIKAETGKDKARLQTIKELIAKGVPPYAARCAAYGKDGDANDSRCSSSSKNYMEMVEARQK